MSDGMIQHFQQLYESMDTDKLIDLQRKGTLRPEAEEVLNAVLEMRGVTPVQRSDIMAELEATSYEDQVKHFAPVGDRIMARVIDTVICFAIAIAVGLAVVCLPDTPSDPLWLLLIPVAFFAYFLYADSMPNGQSFGKKWNGIAVVDSKTHAPCTGPQSFVRNFLLLVSFGIKDIALVLGDQGQRSGDRWARTLVVKVQYLNKPIL